ncbi:uncharacterized protein PHALS_10660 [Plasmopara halstedii]|uniref:Uncharacterized protein n=1 Tax=Plasmopara halstedii TaxID=4781 RepID=A0A0P1AHY5_PLAHL|nr:uncharacterized protein PHALS_10660 [Plasmopara halstedii]CEG40463.1 hypothetical protein PHALS_10660 [Plasmopara halstedii]|eukprot:XP_024576832.1 hypothetical protein PHALS_10660 [Plasmopara halstedii]
MEKLSALKFAGKKSSDGYCIAKSTNLVKLIDFATGADRITPAPAMSNTTILPLIWGPIGPVGTI